jgi:cyanophycinase
MLRSLIIWLALAFSCLASALHAQTPTATAYKYIRVGNAADAVATPRPGYALMGGGTDLDEALKWLCERAGGGDFLVLRATGTDAYNPYIQGLCKLNSVATLIIPSREAAADPFVARAITHASALFIAGGDQAKYINFWMGTPVETAINDSIKRGVPIGGTSAGLAVMGEYAYTAQGDKADGKDLDSKTVLANPFHPRVTLVHGFLDIPILHDIITDSHFAKRDRMGRLLVFLARLNEPEGRPLPPDEGIRGVGIEQRAAVLLEPDGRAEVVGQGCAYFVNWEDTEKPSILKRGEPLTLPGVRVQKTGPGHSFNLKSWTGESVKYTLWVERGAVHSTQTEGAIY